MPGLNTAPISEAAGTISHKSCSRLPCKPAARSDRPVTLPPGRARLATMPAPTGSPTAMKTTGMPFPAALPTLAGTVPNPVTSTSGFIRTRSEARSGKSSAPAFRGAIDEMQVMSVDITKLIEALQEIRHEGAILVRKQRKVADGERFRSFCAGPACDADKCGSTEHFHQRPPVRHANLSPQQASE